MLAAQLLGLALWSAFQARHFALTWDFAGVEQGVYLIAHGDLNPYSSVFGHTLLADHGALVYWPLALLHLLWPHPVTLLWAQDAATIGAELIAFLWICDIVAARLPGRLGVAAILLGALMLTVNPWTVWASSFDIHPEAFAALSAIGTARSIQNRASRRRVATWALLGLATGDVGAGYIGAVGLSACCTRRQLLPVGLAVAAVGFIWMLTLGALHANLGDNLGGFSYLATGSHTHALPDLTAGEIAKALLVHPGRAIDALRGNGLDLWANLAPGGVAGLFWPATAIPSALVLAESQLNYRGFALPGFQSWPAAPFLTVGTIALLALAFRRGPTGRRVGVLAGALLAANSLGWAAVWIPQARKTWVPVTAGSARRLARLLSVISPEDKVVVSQGVAGGFADRRQLTVLEGATAEIGPSNRPVWLILAPRTGVETTSSIAAYGDIAGLESNPNVESVAAADGIWAFRSKAHASISIAAAGRSLPAWALTGSAGSAIEAGPTSAWHAASNGSAGYVVRGGYWREPPGTYSASVTLSASGPANVELWNADSNQLLARLALPGTDGTTTLALTGSLQHEVAPHVFSGWGVWRDAPLLPAGDQLEVRVWSPGGDDIVNVYSVALHRVG